MVRLLLANGADLSVKDKRGRTPVDLAKARAPQLLPLLQPGLHD
jgi:ankyrin repeat protein